MRAFLRRPERKISRIARRKTRKQWGISSRASGCCTLLVVADLTCRAFCPTGSTVGGIKAKVNLTTVRAVLIAVRVIRFTAGNNALAVHTQGSLRIGQEGVAFRPACPAVVHIRIQVNAIVTTKGCAAVRARRSAPGIPADLQCSAGSTADPTVFLIRKNIHAGTAAGDLTIRAGQIWSNCDRSCCGDTRCGSAPECTPAVLTGLPG